MAPVNYRRGGTGGSLFRASPRSIPPVSKRLGGQSEAAMEQVGLSQRPRSAAAPGPPSVKKGLAGEGYSKELSKGYSSSKGSSAGDDLRPGRLERNGFLPIPVWRSTSNLRPDGTSKDVLVPVPKVVLDSQRWLHYTPAERAEFAEARGWKL